MLRRIARAWRDALPELVEPHRAASEDVALELGGQLGGSAMSFGTEFGYGGMPYEEAELNMRPFADRVMRVLKRGAAFAPA